MPKRGKPAEDLTPYAGRWVARLRGRVVGQGGTPQQALRAAKTNRPKEQPEITYVPTSQPLTFSKLLDKIRLVLPEDVPVFLVGGAVRDALLQRPTHDLDFAVDGDGIQVARQVADALNAAFVPLDPERGTGRVVLLRESGQYTIDFASLRGEDIESDLRARDFTINALAVDVRAPDKLLDPLGGALDLHRKILRPCSPTAFLDDPLRTLRAIRQATNFKLKIDPETRSLMRQAAERLPNVSAERQRDELYRILEGEQPATALRALELLGVLPYLLPELVPLKGVQQSAPHLYDVWEHTLQTVQRLEFLLDVVGARQHDPDAAASLAIGLAVLRLGRYRQQIHAHVNEQILPGRGWRPSLFLAALYHDAGKPETAQEDESGRIRFFGHERVSAKLAGQRAHSLRLSRDEISRIKTVVRHHMRPHFLAQSGKPPTRRAVYRFFRDTRQAGVDICLLALADVMATYGSALPQDTWTGYLDVIRTLLEAWWERPQESVSPPTLLKGNDLISEFGLQPGPQIGELLELVREAQAAGQIETREQALKLIGEQLQAG